VKSNRISLKVAREQAVKLLGAMGTARVNKKTGPGARYQIGLSDPDGVLEERPTAFKKLSEGRDFAEALDNAAELAGLAAEAQP
jgi:hypothetical protein